MELKQDIITNATIIGKEHMAEQTYHVSIDTRTIDTDVPEIFLALKGERVDGHDFLADAIRNGAKGLIISDKAKLPEIASDTEVFVIVVPDTMQALIELARFWRNQLRCNQLPCHVVGVTGSVGKTTTKEMLRTIFEAAGIDAYVSHGNQNTLVGVCLNLLKVKRSHRIAVFEVGISEKHEMDMKADVLRPTMGVITSVAHAHMHGLGQLPEIASEKKKLFSFFKSDDVGIVNGDQPLLGDAYYTHPIVRFGFKTKHHVQARNVRDNSFFLKIYKEKKKVHLATNHKGNMQNALAASCVAHLLGVPFDTIVQGLEAYRGFTGRFEQLSLRDNKGILISDCYNASPASMKAALVAVDETDFSGKKIAVLGDMLELGEKETFWHRQIGRVLHKTPSIETIVLVGERAKHIAQTAPKHVNVTYAADWRQAVDVLPGMLGESSLVLVKASNAMELKHLVEAFAN